jgi:ADP-ribosyl-[dinitrogen reductase] hydrolase
MTDNNTGDRCQGVMIGLAAGDRNGGPIRMAVRLAESLLDCGGFDPADILGRYLRWWREGAFDTGPVSGRALELLAAGVRVADAAAQVHREFGGHTAGCNPAHRSPPLAMHAAVADDDLAGCAKAEARLTHFDPLAGEVAAAADGLCRSLIRGVRWGDAFSIDSVCK